MSTPVKVFISYAHEETPEHGERVLDLADRLVSNGVDVRLDRYVDAPRQGWQLWMEDEIEDVDFVLVVASATYERRRRGKEAPGRGHGVFREGLIISQALYESHENEKFIPVYFEPAAREHIPIFLRAFNAYGVESDEGYEDLLRRLTGQPKVVKPPLGTAPVLPPRQRRSRGAREPQIAIARLPATGETFVAREDELARLDDAWAGDTNVITFVAMGGAGKSALVNRFLERLREDAWRGAERVLGWSFYSQGTEGTGASSEAFTEFALDWLGYEGDVMTSPWRKGEKIAELVRRERTLLVLDGLEPLQHPPGAQTGRLKDPAVQALVKELAVQNAGLCVITTRLPVADVAGRDGVVEVDLEKLPPAAGAELLRRLGCHGSQKEMRQASKDFGGHGLALTLLGTYLRDVEDGDVRKRKEVEVLGEDVEGGAHARRVMASYAAWLGEGRELQILRLLGLFDRPAEAAALEALRALPEIAGLTEGIAVDEEKAWRESLARLRKARLVLPAEGGTGGLDAHPLVREYFGERLRERSAEAWRAGNERLYEHYRETAEDLPETLEGLMPLYAAVVHGCRAGREQEACDEVYVRRIHRGDEFFSTKKLGAFGAELSALASFFERAWDRPSAGLRASDRAWLLNAAGFRLRALGRLPEAVQPMRAGLEQYKSDESWKAAAITAGNLSELSLTLGDVASAVSAGEESVELADRSGDAFQRMANRTTLADALHQEGRLEESAAAFREAEALQAERQPRYPRLYSLQGYRYCDLLLSLAEGEDEARYKKACQEIQERAEEALGIVLRGSKNLLDIALDHLTLARAHLALALTSPSPPDAARAAEHLARAVDGLRQAGDESYLPWGLLAQSTHLRLTASPQAALPALQEAQEIAERGHMLLHLADVHLEYARLHLQEGDPQAARPHVARAGALIQKTGYLRRQREHLALAASAGVEPGSPGAPS